MLGVYSGQREPRRTVMSSEGHYLIDTSERSWWRLLKLYWNQEYTLDSWGWVGVKGFGNGWDLGHGERRSQGVTQFLSLDGGWWKVLFEVGKEVFGGRGKKGELCFRDTYGDVQCANRKVRNLRERPENVFWFNDTEHISDLNKCCLCEVRLEARLEVAEGWVACGQIHTNRNRMTEEGRGQQPGVKKGLFVFEIRIFLCFFLN